MFLLLFIVYFHFDQIFYWILWVDIILNLLFKGDIFCLSNLLCAIKAFLIYFCHLHNYWRGLEIIFFFLLKLLVFIFNYIYRY